MISLDIKLFMIPIVQTTPIKLGSFVDLTKNIRKFQSKPTTSTKKNDLVYYCIYLFLR